jgi:hypothetical protein
MIESTGGGSPAGVGAAAAAQLVVVLADATGFFSCRLRR